LCKGCGTCTATCRDKAISLIHFDDQQIVNEMMGALALANTDS
jgi:heterodisulfide reductase subunit A-like polyferredoxin